MNLRSSSKGVVCALAVVGCVLILSSCSSAPTAPGGRVEVYVSQDGLGPAAGKVIEIVGTTLTETTDGNGQAFFVVRAGTYEVRAYDLGTPGPSRPYVEQTIEVHSARTTHAQFNDCRYCR